MKKGEIWILEFPSKGKREQEGVRPGLVISDSHVDLILTVPLTSNLQALRFPHTIEIKKSESNNLEKDSVALVFHLQSLDKRRFARKIGELSREDINKIEFALKKLLKF